MRLFRQRHPTERIRDVGPDEAERAIRAGAVLLDVREEAEWAAGHAPGAVHLPLGQLADAARVLPAGLGVVAVCRSGNRSRRAAEALAAGGYDVVNLAGGMRAWARSGRPVLGDGARPGEVI